MASDSVHRDPKPPWTSSLRAAAVVTVAIAAGAALSGQAFYNGRLANSFGTAEMAGLVCSVVGATVSGLVAIAAGGARRALRQWEAGARPRGLHLAGGLLVAFPVIVSAEAAGTLGVALLTVALVSGQTCGSLLIDRTGIGPGGRRPLTRARLMGAVIAVAAVGLTVAEGAHHLAIGLLIVAVVAGTSVAMIQAFTGHLTKAFDDPAVASAVMFAAAACSTFAAWIVVNGGDVPNGLSAPIEAWLGGGLLGVAITIAVGLIVTKLGSLRLTLALVAGQSLGALFLDLIDPVAGRAVTPTTVVSLGLVFGSVIISSDRLTTRSHST